MAGMTAELIAPCGMNCRLCRDYQKEKGRCGGCRPGPDGRSLFECRIKTCAMKLESALPFCYACHDFPCRRLKKLDARYRAKYRMSQIENLENIRDNGLDEFLRGEADRWKCAECGSVLCVHNAACPSCGTPAPEQTSRIPQSRA